MICNQLDDSPVSLRDSLIDELNTSNITCSLEELSQLLRELADQEELEAKHSRTHIGNPVKCYTAPLAKVNPGPFQSLGGYFDYSNWVARDRFLELDKAISLVPCHRSYATEPDLLAA